MKKKKILFVINTFGSAGAEHALVTLIKSLDKRLYEVYLYILLEQGDLSLPPEAKLLNRRFSALDVWTPKGRSRMYRTLIRLSFKRLCGLKRLPYLCVNMRDMIKKRRIYPDKLMWKIVSDGAERFDTPFDLAVAYIEGGSAYYVSDHVNACKKAVFIHTDYNLAGYTKRLDRGCYENFDRIFTVSDEVKTAFLQNYPEYRDKTEVFPNLLDVENIKKRSLEKGGFSDGYDGFRILTVGRLTPNKSCEIAVKAMGILKKRGVNARWYVLGEGNQRKSLEKLIKDSGLENDFILLGADPNPFPYYRQTDLYVHATKYEGKSLAVQEARILGCAMLLSDCSGNREQVRDGIDGKLCPLSPEDVADAAQELINDPQKLAEYRRKTVENPLINHGPEKLTELINTN